VSETNVIGRWNELIRAQVSQGKTKREAVMTLHRRYPVLHREYLRQTQCTDLAARMAGAPTTALDAEIAAAELAMEQTAVAVEESGHGDAVAEFNHAVAAIMATGKSRQESVKLAAKQNPTLHKRYVAATNAQDPQVQELIRQRFTTTTR
jgi:hypothetical protein